MSKPKLLFPALKIKRILDIHIPHTIVEEITPGYSLAIFIISKIGITVHIREKEILILTNSNRDIEYYTSLARFKIRVKELKYLPVITDADSIKRKEWWETMKLKIAFGVLYLIFAVLVVMTVAAGW